MSSGSRGASRSEAEELLLRAFFSRMHGEAVAAHCLETIVVRMQPPGFSWEHYVQYILTCAKHYASQAIDLELLEDRFFSQVDSIVEQEGLSHHLYLDSQILRAYAACIQNNLVAADARLGIAEMMIAQGLHSNSNEPYLRLVRQSLHPSR